MIDPAKAERIEQIFEQWLIGLKFSPFQASVAVHIALFLLLLLGGWLAYFVAKRVMLGLLTQAIQRTKTKWDDQLLERKFFHILAHLAPAVVVHAFAPTVFYDLPRVVLGAQTLATVYMLIVGLFAFDALLNATHDIYSQHEISRRIPIKGFIQVIKIVVYFVGAIAVIAFLVQKNPIVLLSGLGALTAVLLLIFKDAILGFVAGIQLTTNNMVAVGDWIEMPKYGADGDVIDVALTTVKVQNWDRTITTVPTYALISDSFKNWRGMSDSGGRRIMRSIHIDMHSVRFCDEPLLERFAQIKYLSEYVETKKKEIAGYNERMGVDDSVLVNGRRMTNLGTFRAYIISYLRNHPKIHQDMTFLVRHLEPTERGIPIQLYVFSNDQVWANYESIQADIFDHILAVLPFFELRVFQNPSGSDVRSIAEHLDRADTAPAASSPTR